MAPGATAKFGIVVVAHGNLARELLAVLEHVMGPQQGVCAICIGADDDMQERRAEILECVQGCAGSDGAVVLTDMFGGTPSNLAISLMDKVPIEVLAGINLPMLVKLASLRAHPIAEAVRLAQEAGRKYIAVSSAILGRKGA
jgi:PTS system mannose-specific IIA component